MLRKPYKAGSLENPVRFAALFAPLALFAVAYAMALASPSECQLLEPLLDFSWFYTGAETLAGRWPATFCQQLWFPVALASSYFAAALFVLWDFGYSFLHRERIVQAVPVQNLPKFRSPRWKAGFALLTIATIFMTAWDITYGLQGIIKMLTHPDGTITSYLRLMFLAACALISWSVAFMLVTRFQVINLVKPGHTT